MGNDVQVGKAGGTRKGFLFANMWFGVFLTSGLQGQRCDTSAVCLLVVLNERQSPIFGVCDVIHLVATRFTIG